MSGLFTNVNKLNVDLLCNSWTHNGIYIVSEPSSLQSSMKSCRDAVGNTIQKPKKYCTRKLTMLDAILNSLQNRRHCKVHDRSSVLAFGRPQELS